MSTFQPPALLLDPALFQQRTGPDGHRWLSLGGGALITAGKPLDLRLLAVQLMELANDVEADQRAKGESP